MISDWFQTAHLALSECLESVSSIVADAHVWPNRSAYNYPQWTYDGPLQDQSGPVLLPFPRITIDWFPSAFYDALADRQASDGRRSMTFGLYLGSGMRGKDLHEAFAAEHPPKIFVNIFQKPGQLVPTLLHEMGHVLHHEIFDYSEWQHMSERLLLNTYLQSNFYPSGRKTLLNHQEETLLNHTRLLEEFGLPSDAGLSDFEQLDPPHMARLKESLGILLFLRYLSDPKEVFARNYVMFVFLSNADPSVRQFADTLDAFDRIELFEGYRRNVVTSMSVYADREVCKDEFRRLLKGRGLNVR